MEATKGAPAVAGAVHFTRATLADRWSVTTRHVDALVAKGKLRPLKIGGATRFTLADVEAFEATHARVVEAPESAPEAPPLRSRVIAATRKLPSPPPAPLKSFRERVAELKSRMSPGRAAKGAAR